MSEAKSIANIELSKSRDKYTKRTYSSRPYTSVSLMFSCFVSSEDSAIFNQSEYPQLKKQYWGQHLWARGYFCAIVGTITEEMIKEYIEKHE